MKYMLDTNVLMHFANDERKSYKINKHLDRAGHENIFVSSITIHEVSTKGARVDFSGMTVN